MAFTITNVITEAEVFVADVIASADADTGPLNVPHALGAAPNRVTVTPLLTNFYTSQWIVSGITATNVVLTKANAVGSGNAANQIRVCAWLSYSPDEAVRQPDREVSPVGTVV